MASLNLRMATPAAYTALTAEPTIGGITLTWDARPELLTEVWMSATSTFGSAVKIETTNANSVFVSVAPNITKYFWIIPVNAFFQKGDVYPAGAGISASANGVTSNDVTGGSVNTSSTSISITNTSPTITDYDTYYTVSTLTFTPSANDYIQAFLYFGGEVTGFVHSAGSFSWLNIRTRLRLYNNTTSSDVKGGTTYGVVYINNKYPGPVTKIHGNASFVASENINLISGFRGLLAPGQSYTLFYEIAKIRENGTPTCTLTVNAPGISSEAASLS